MRPGRRTNDTGGRGGTTDINLSFIRESIHSPNNFVEDMLLHLTNAPKHAPLDHPG